MAILDVIGNICAGLCLVYFVAVVIYTAVDMRYLPGKSFLTVGWEGDDDEEE